MSDIMIDLLAAFGLTFTLCASKILSKPRDALRKRSTFVEQLLDCMFCSGFWVSLVIFTLRLPFTTTTWYVGTVLLHAFAGASFVYLFDSLLLTLESNARNTQKE